MINSTTDWDAIKSENPWLLSGPLVAKPDQLFGKRGKHGLVFANKLFSEVETWVRDRIGKMAKVGEISDYLTDFIIEPFIKHETEFYTAIKSHAEGDTIYFSLAGGVDVEANWEKVVQYKVPVLGDPNKVEIEKMIPANLENLRDLISSYLIALYKLFVALHFTYLEINPFAVSKTDIFPLDMVAKLDDTAEFLCRELWGESLDFPPPFGRKLIPEEKKVRELDAMSGASLKLTVLNPEGRIWNMVAGGGASVIFADTVCDLGFSNELAMYGEYSGDPSTQLTYEYSKVVFDLMTKMPDPKGRPKSLIIGGGIANFTDVAKTFTGIIKAIKEYSERFKKADVRIFVRRGGPNYQEGLSNIKSAVEALGIPIQVHGPEYHMTQIVSDAMKEH
ncbi:ATPase [bacterium]|nr:ATPase [bacterium]